MLLLAVGIGVTLHVLAMKTLKQERDARTPPCCLYKTRQHK
jgi:hypothetical protein